jgi:NTP pyrophosphatase (non-canonical NTP hydrolase)
MKSKPLTLRRLQQTNMKRAQRWHTGPKGSAEWSPLEWAGAMCGEAGEAANFAKKLKRIADKITNLDKRTPKNKRNMEYYRRQIGKEVADTIIYGVILAAEVHCDIERTVRDVFNKKSRECGFPERL